MRSGLRAILIAIVAGALPFAACSTGPDRHEDGAGVVQFSPGATERYTMGPDVPGADWSYGMFVCTSDPDDPPILVEVAVTGLTGGGIFLGARFLPSPEAAGELIGTAHGFPPAGLDDAAMLEVEGQPLSRACGPGFTSQLVLGLRLSGDGDGGFTGEEVTYDHGGRRHILVLHNTFIFCGANTGGVEACVPRESASDGD